MIDALDDAMMRSQKMDKTEVEMKSFDACIIPDEGVYMCLIENGWVPVLLGSRCKGPDGTEAVKVTRLGLGTFEYMTDGDATSRRWVFGLKIDQVVQSDEALQDALDDALKDKAYLEKRLSEVEDEYKRAFEDQLIDFSDPSRTRTKKAWLEEVNAQRAKSGLLALKVTSDGTVAIDDSKR